MAFIPGLMTPAPFRLQVGPIGLRHPRPEDYQAWAQLRHESRAFLEPWEPIWPVDDLDRSSYRLRLKRYAQDISADFAYPFFIFLARERQLVGGINLSNIRRGVAQTATIGYWMGASYAGQGLMTHALRGVIHFAFADLMLHRLEAACLPENEPSRRLLLRAGFEEEGYARRYLKIAGRWQDHRLFGLSRMD